MRFPPLQITVAAFAAACSADLLGTKSGGINVVAGTWSYTLTERIPLAGPQGPPPK